MKERVLTLFLLVAHVCMQAQVGIGTTTPSIKSILDIQSTEKGLLIPRLTFTQRTAMSLSVAEAGMMVYQTDHNTTPKGLYTFDGINWLPPLLTGTSNGQTLRWDGNKWASSNTLFNSGSAIGINTTSPNCQLQVHAGISYPTKMQITNGNNHGYSNDGLVIGVGQLNSSAFIAQQENKPLYFSTNNVERMRIDSAGNIGVGITAPAAKLDINGSVKIGTNGTSLSGIMRSAIMVPIPSLLGNAGMPVTVSFPNAAEGATVYISPAESLTDLGIAYARVSNPGTIEIKFINFNLLPCPADEIMFYVTVIQ